MRKLIQNLFLLFSFSISLEINAQKEFGEEQIVNRNGVTAIFSSLQISCNKTKNWTKLKNGIIESKYFSVNLKVMKL